MNLILFQFESNPIRVVTDDNGEPWFNAKEICNVLGYGNHRQAVDTHVDTDDLTKREVIDNMGRKQLANHINESGLYALIFGSTKDEAKRFKRWVTRDVLPAIRKTGRYEAESAPPMPASVSHRADHIVSAARCFNGLMRAASSLKIGHARAAMAANQAALRHAGVNILEELGVAPSELVEEAKLLLEKDDLAQRVKTWLEAPEQMEAHSFTSAEIMQGLFGIGPADDEYRSLVTRLGYAMVRIGWKKQRSSGPGRSHYYQRPK